MTATMTTAPEIDVAELERLMTAGEVHLLDVRQDWEWRRSQVGGAIHVPLGMLPMMIWKLPRDRPLAVICEHGDRSLAAAHFLQARGFAGATSVRGGMAAWSRSRQPLGRERS
jgi:rhodanese-related sulfurtransferase